MRFGLYIGIAFAVSITQAHAVQLCTQPPCFLVPSNPSGNGPVGGALPKGSVHGAEGGGEAARCQSGYVWRERFEGDAVCATLDPDAHILEVVEHLTACSEQLADGADAWFDFRNVDRFEIQEQSFLLPNDEVLTLLILPDEALE